MAALSRSLPQTHPLLLVTPSRTARTALSVPGSSDQGWVLRVSSIHWRGSLFQWKRASVAFSHSPVYRWCSEAHRHLCYSTLGSGPSRTCIESNTEGNERCVFAQWGQFFNRDVASSPICTTGGGMGCAILGQLRGYGVCDPRPARPGRARLGMTLEPLLCQVECNLRYINVISNT